MDEAKSHGQVHKRHHTKHDEARATTLSDAQDGGQTLSTERKKHQNLVEPSSQATDCPLKTRAMVLWEALLA